MRDLRVQLVAHLGGKPSATQRALIERICWLSLRVALLDAQMVRDGGLSEHSSRAYLAWSNSLSRTLAHLGLEGAPESPADLRTYIALREVERAA